MAARVTSQDPDPLRRPRRRARPPPDRSRRARSRPSAPPAGARPSPPSSSTRSTIADLQTAHGVGRRHRALARREVHWRASRRSTARARSCAPSSRSTPTRSRSPTGSTPSARPAKLRGPLHGIPVLLKDNIDTADRMKTTAGSLALLGATPSADAFLVGRLRDAGAVILGKTNLCEWANFRSTHSSSGWSGRGGQCRNPVRARPQPVGLELRLGRRDRREPLRGRRRHRDRRLDRVAVEQLRPRRHQADARPRLAAAASSRSRTARTPPGRWRAPSPTPRSC